MVHTGATTLRGFCGSAVVLGALVLLSACSSAPAPDSTAEAEPPVSGTSTPTPTPTPTPFDWENERLLAEYGPAPLDAMYDTPEEDDIYSRAKEILVVQCLTDLGFPEIPEVEGEYPDEVVPRAAWDDSLGLVDLKVAQTFGYQGARDSEWWAAHRAYIDLMDAHRELYADPARDLAEYGLPDGCERQAAASLSPVDTSALDRDLIASLPDLAVQQTQADPAVVESMTRWTSCMAEAGYALTAIPIPQAHPDPATPEQIAQAVADVECKQSTGLVDTYITALYANQRAFMDQHTDQVTLKIAAREASLEAARQLLGE
jgi:hypothetical protein